MLFTVFTPTYNRAHTLSRVYESLRSQTFRDFEWLIIDDGSTDDTAKVVSEWVMSADFPIRYIYQDHQHKKAAHNRAVSEARGELMVVLDSDDRCVPDALETFERYWKTIARNERHEFWCVCALCMDEDGSIIGDRFPGREWVDSNSLEMRYRHKVRGEKWGAMCVHILRRYPFPSDLPGLVPEGVVWGEIAKCYKTRFFNEPLRVYCQDAMGIIARKGEVSDAARDAVGAAFAKERVLSSHVRYFRHSPLWFFLEAARLVRFYIHAPRAHKRLIRFWPHSFMGKGLVVMAAPVGILMWGRDRVRYKLRSNGRTGRQ